MRTNRKMRFNFASHKCLGKFVIARNSIVFRSYGISPAFLRIWFFFLLLLLYVVAFRFFGKNLIYWKVTDNDDASTTIDINDSKRTYLMVRIVWNDIDIVHKIIQRNNKNKNWWFLVSCEWTMLRRLWYWADGRWIQWARHIILYYIIEKFKSISFGK